MLTCSASKPWTSGAHERFQFAIGYGMPLKQRYFHTVLPPSSAKTPSMPAYHLRVDQTARLETEDDVLHLRDLPDFDGFLPEAQAPRPASNRPP